MIKIIKLIKNNLLAFIGIIKSIITQVLLFIGAIFESLVTIIGIIFKYVAGLALIIILVIWIFSDKEIQKYSETEIDQMLGESWNDGYGQGRAEGIKFICDETDEYISECK